MVCNTLFGVFTPVVFAALFSVAVITGGISIIGTTLTFASFISIIATVTLISTFVVDITPDFVFSLVILATVLSASVSVFAVGSISGTAEFIITDTFSSVFAVSVVVLATVTVLFAFICPFAPVPSYLTAVFRALLSVLTP